MAIIFPVLFIAENLPPWQCAMASLQTTIRQNQERLSKLSLPSLVYRRQRGDLIFLYQLINQHFNIDINDFFRYQTYTTTRGHNYKIYKPHAKRFCRVNFFTLRTINNWNSLAASVVESATVNSFKNSLDSFWSYKHYISD